MLLAETKELEIMDTSSKQQRTYEECVCERERVGREMEKAKRWKLEKSQLESEKSEERKKKEDQKKK